MEVTLDLAYYGAMYRALGCVAGQQVFRLDLHPTYAAEVDRVIQAAVWGEDVQMTVTA